MRYSREPKHAGTGSATELLMPDTGYRARPAMARARDVSDAEFEVIGTPGRTHSSEPDRTRGVSTPAPKESLKPDPGFNETARNTLFVGRARDASDQGRAIARPAFVAGVAFFALASFWMAGGHALATRDADPSTSDTRLEVAPSERLIVDTPAMNPTPETTASTPETEITRPAPRPARIERAGSILMIRPDGG